MVKATNGGQQELWKFFLFWPVVVALKATLIKKPTIKNGLTFGWNSGCIFLPQSLVMRYPFHDFLRVYGQIMAAHKAEHITSTEHSMVSPSCYDLPLQCVWGACGSDIRGLRRGSDRLTLMIWVIPIWQFHENINVLPLNMECDLMIGVRPNSNLHQCIQIKWRHFHANLLFSKRYFLSNGSLIQRHLANCTKKKKKGI